MFLAIEQQISSHAIFVCTHVTDEVKCRKTTRLDFVASCASRLGDGLASGTPSMMGSTDQGRALVLCLRFEGGPGLNVDSFLGFFFAFAFGRG